MKTHLIFLLVLLSPHGFGRGEPRMVVRNPDNTFTMLQVSRAEVSVRFTLDVAETEYLLTFYNDRDRDIEGEFTLPLPEGATVSSYALEVNGKLREGVAVEKARARTAYESVKRRMIDPGLVEREAGNIYRTRVYPIPARGTKQLRLRFIETLPAANNRLLYSLPLHFNGETDSFVCRLSGDGLEAGAIAKPAGLDFHGDGPGCLVAELSKKSPSGVLQVTRPEPEGPAMIATNSGKPVFYLRDVMPAVALQKRATPKKIQLTWDASGSGRSRDHGKEMALLDAWFRSLGNTTVDLHLLRNELSRVGLFEVKNGDWKRLRRTLESIHYDGGTDLSAIALPDESADTAVFVGDGAGSIGGLPSAAASRLIFVRSGPEPHQPNSGLVRLTAPAQRIDLARLPVAEALPLLTHIQLRLLEVRGPALGKHHADPDPKPGHALHVSGHLLNPGPGRLELVYGCDGMEPVIRKVDYQTGGDYTESLVERLHAQRVLAAMENAPRVDVPALVSHCKQHGLVSDHTSFIVLERLEDYAEHGIRPPEAELAKAYEELVERRKLQVTATRGPFAPAWRDRMRWYQMEFPGYEHIILPRLRRVAIWKQAVESQFPPEWRDKDSFTTIANWHDQVRAAIDRKPKLRDGGEYLTWVAEIDTLHQTGATLAKLPVKPPPSGTPLAVSVNGLVNRPGVVKQEGPMTLTEALAKAGGIHPAGTAGRIALYRNISKTIYNTRSREFKDPALLPCDMVVAENDYHDSSCDPFSERKPTSLEEQPAVLVEMDPVAAAGASQAPGAERTRFLTPSGKPEIILPAPEESTVPDLDAFRKSLATTKDPEALYAKAAGAVARPPEFHIEAGKLLFAAGHRQLALRVWSNLPESRPGNPAALRAMAWWLADAGLHQEALDLLKSAEAWFDPGSESLVLNTLFLTAGSDKPPLPPGDLMDWKSGKLACIAAMHGVPADVPGTSVRPLPADLRVELHASDPRVFTGFYVTAPDGTRSYMDSIDTHGGLTTGDDGIHEYLCRKAMPGTYQIHCRAAGPCTVRIRIHTRWAKSGHQSRTVTLLLDEGELVKAADVAVGFSSGDE